MSKLLYAAVIVLLILHQDFWLWRDRTLFLGFIPSGLAFHAAYTLVAALLMGLLAKHAWPAHLEESIQRDIERGTRTP